MPTQLSPLANKLMTDPYSGAPGFLGVLANILLPNPQVPYTFGSIVSPRGSLTSLVPKGGGEKGAPTTAVLREQLSALANEPYAKEMLYPFYANRPSPLPVNPMESKSLRELIEAYSSFLGVDPELRTGAQPADFIRKYTGPRRGKVRASMSYPSSEDVEHFVDNMRGMYMAPFFRGD